MYLVAKDTGNELPFVIMDENDCVVARARCKQDAVEIVAAWNLLETLAVRFPGFVNGQDSVNGGDLVDFVNRHVTFRKDGRFRPA